MKENKAKDAYSLVFDSWDEFVEFAATPTKRPGVRNESRNNSAEESWDLSEGFDGCVKLGRNGWKQPVAEVEGLAGHVETKVETTIEDNTFENVYDVAGAEVDVAVYLSGEPECMIESSPIRVSRHGRAVRVIVPHYTSCMVNAEAFRRRGAAIVALCDALAKRQHPVEVVVIYQSIMLGKKRTAHKLYQYVVPVQAANEALDVERLLAATAHPGSFRRLGFAVVENSPDVDVAKGMTHGRYGLLAPRDALIKQADALIGEVDNSILPQDLNCYNERSWSEDATAQWVVETINHIFD